MLKVNFFHICETAIVEHQTGNISIIGVFENINGNKFPATHPQMTLVAGFESDKPGSYDIEVVFSDENGEIIRIPTKIEIGKNLKGNWFYKIQLYQVRSELTQNVKIVHGGTTISEKYLTVNNK